MTDILSSFLFTSAGLIGILSVCGLALAALPWRLADQAATARGLVLGGQRLVALLLGIYAPADADGSGITALSPSPSVAGPRPS